MMHIHDLTVGTPSADAPTVIAVHGITGNGLNWALLSDVVARRFGEGRVRLFAPDLRGRGDSPVPEGDLGLDVHVSELAALARTLPQPPLLLGHSMGAAVCVLLGARHPDLISGLVLVDGGLNFPIPPGVRQQDIDTTLRVALGPAMKRLERSFDSPQSYVDFVTDHPALGPLLTGDDSDVLRRYVDHDTRPSSAGDGRYVSSCVLDSIRADGRDVFFHPSLAGALRTAVAKGVRTEFLWAPRGLFDEPQGLYDKERLGLLNVPAEVRVTKVPDTNHYSIVLARKGLAYVVDAVERLLGLGADQRSAAEATPLRPSDDVQPGQVYEDCSYHPVYCTDRDEDTVTGISLIDGSTPRTCDLRSCGVRILEVADVVEARRDHAAYLARRQRANGTVDAR